MLKKEIKYVNALGEEVNKPFYFNLTFVERSKLEARYINPAKYDTLQKYVDTLLETQSVDKLLEFLEDLILSAYGERRDDGGMDKSPETRKAFEYSLAYPELFEELLTVDGAMDKFIEASTEKPVKTSIASAKVVQ